MELPAPPYKYTGNGPFAAGHCCFAYGLTNGVNAESSLPWCQKKRIRSYTEKRAGSAFVTAVTLRLPGLGLCCSCFGCRLGRLCCDCLPFFGCQGFSAGLSALPTCFCRIHDGQILHLSPKVGKIYCTSFLTLFHLSPKVDM